MTKTWVTYRIATRARRRDPYLWWAVFLAALVNPIFGLAVMLYHRRQLRWGRSC